MAWCCHAPSHILNQIWPRSMLSYDTARPQLVNGVISEHILQINPLRAKFFRRNINMYLHFMSFFHIDLTQVLKILPHVREGPTYSI